MENQNKTSETQATLKSMWEIVYELDLLFQFSSPQKIRKSIQAVFFDYLVKSHNNLSQDFENIASDFNYLLRFFENIDKHVEIDEETA